MPEGQGQRTACTSCLAALPVATAHASGTYSWGRKELDGPLAIVNITSAQQEAGVIIARWPIKRAVRTLVRGAVFLLDAGDAGVATRSNWLSASRPRTAIDIIVPGSLGGQRSLRCAGSPAWWASDRLVVAHSGTVRVKVQCALAAYAVELRTQPREQRGGSTACWHGVSRPVQSPATPRVLIYSASGGHLHVVRAGGKAALMSRTGGAARPRGRSK